MMKPLPLIAEYRTLSNERNRVLRAYRWPYMMLLGRIILKSAIAVGILWPILLPMVVLRFVGSFLAALDVEPLLDRFDGLTGRRRDRELRQRFVDGYRRRRMRMRFEAEDHVRTVGGPS